MIRTNFRIIKFKRIIICLIVSLVFPLFISVNNYSYAEGTGKIVVTNDDWPFSFYGFIYNDSSTIKFATNVANWFVEGRTGNFLAYKTFAFSWLDLEFAITSNGHNWTLTSEIPNDLNDLLAYDGIFIADNNVDNNLLIEYVKSGGNVYLSGGTEDRFLSNGDGAIDEAAQWNSFLNYFGLAFSPLSPSEPNDYNNITGSMDIQNTHPIFEEVSNLFQSSGNDILDLDPMDDRGEVLVSYEGHGLYAVFEGSQDYSNYDDVNDQNYNQVDSDIDGVLDANDACPKTSIGEIVDVDGCSINDLCPCDWQWKNHGSYVKCTAQASELFVTEGLIDEMQKELYVSNAAEAHCGRKK